MSAGASEKPRGQVSLQVLHLACVIKFAFLNPGMLGASVEGWGWGITGLGLGRWHLSVDYVLLGKCPYIPKSSFPHLCGEVCMTSIFVRKCLEKECNFLKFLFSSGVEKLGIYFTK